MANSRSRKSAPTRPGISRDQRAKAGSTRAAVTKDDPTDPTDDDAIDTDASDDGDDTDDDTDDDEVVTGSTKVTTRTTAKPAKTAPAAKKASAAKKPTTAKPAAKPSAAKVSSAGSSGRRFGDGATSAGATSAGARKGSGPTKTGGRGRRGGRPAPAVRVAAPKPWGMIVATVGVLVFAAGAIGYAVYQANSNAIPSSPEDIKGITTTQYAKGQQHVTTDETYAESPAIGGPHDGIWADCDGAIYDMQVRAENAVHSLEHGAIWITYNPNISDADLSVLKQYVQDQPYIFMSPYAGLKSLISLQSWNHQLFVDSVDDSRINAFIQVLRQNPAQYPEIGASCTNTAFLSDPVIEGEQSRAPGGAPAVSDAPTAP
ncbi:MAG: DUF3105 domain-containing protein [Geodermatophilaceae bacterium]|nr:DUF3105 domain-containing protein [Geodermatophilaceae bacterium]